MKDIFGTDAIGRAFSPCFISQPIPGALPQAGIERAYGAKTRDDHGGKVLNVRPSPRPRPQNQFFGGLDLDFDLDLFYEFHHLYCGLLLHFFGGKRAIQPDDAGIRAEPCRLPLGIMPG
jgi:hypothetical protein